MNNIKKILKESALIFLAWLILCMVIMAIDSNISASTKLTNELDSYNENIGNLEIENQDLQKQIKELEVKKEKDAQAKLAKEAKDAQDKIDAEKREKEKNLPADYKSALRQAETYFKYLHLSKQAIYDQLTSEYGGKFDSKAAQYAIDNLNVDYKEAALASAKSYQEILGLSKQATYDQLASSYGGKFEASEAQYAVDNLS